MQISSQFNQAEMGYTRASNHSSRTVMSMEDFRDLKGAEPCGTTHGAELHIRYELAQSIIVSPAFADVAALPCSCTLLLGVFLPCLAIDLLLHCVAVLPACSCSFVTLRVSYK